MRIALLCPCIVAIGMLDFTAGPRAEADRRSIGMKTYETPYYTIHTDIGTDDEREAEIRMTRMAEEYAARTRGFSGQISQRLPFYLFKNADDYYAEGGIPGSAGVFVGDKLMAIAGDKAGGTTWHIVQHEGFHQFAHAVIVGELPVWVNEGIAEYFGESLFTGDGFVTGLVPPWRLKRVKQEIEQKQAHSIKEMMLMSGEQWNGDLQILNYDVAWSMVHFLVNGEDGRYQKAFTNFILLLGHGRPWEQAWQESFGNAIGFEQRWGEYWLSEGENPTAALYAQATCATLTSFLARAHRQKQKFESFDAFVSTAKSGELKAAPEDWLPPGLLAEALRSLGTQEAFWSLEAGGDKAPHLTADLPDKTHLIGQFATRTGRGWNVWVETDDTGPVLDRARALIQDGKKDKARGLIQDALRREPKGKHADEARKLIPQTK